MTFVQGVKKGIRRWLSKSRSGGSFESFIFGGSGDSDYDIASNPAGYAKAYKLQVWVHRCVDLLASCISSVPLRLYDVDKDGVRAGVVANHPLVVLLADVNPFNLNYSTLMRSTESSLKTFGNNYWYLEYGGGSLPREIYWLRPQGVTIIPSAKAGEYISAYEYQASPTSKIIYPAESIIHMKYFNPLDDYYGLSPIESIRTAIEADLYAQAFNRMFFQNSARPDGFFTTTEDITDEQADQAERTIKQNFRGSNKAHVLGMLRGGMKFQELGTKPRDAEWAELRHTGRTEFCGAFGVPESLATAEAANYATAMEQKKSLWDETIIPELVYIAETLNRSLKPRFPGTENMRLEFDLSDVPALVEQTMKNYERLQKAAGVPIITPNEARGKIGLDDTEGGDVIYIPMNYIPAGENVTIEAEGMAVEE